MLPADEVQVRRRGMGTRHDLFRPQHGAVLELDADRTTRRADHDAGGARVGADLRTRRTRRPRERLGDAAHAAVHPAPRAEMTVDLTDPMVHQDVGGSRGHRSPPRTDDSLRRQGAFDPRILEPLIEEIGGAHGEQPDQLVDVSACPPAEPRARPGPAEDVGHPHVRGDDEQQPSDQVPDVGEVSIEGNVCLGVMLVEARDVLHVTPHVAPERERRSVGERDEVIGGHWGDAVAEGLQIQLRDYPLRQQRDDVRGRGDAVAVPHRFGDGRAPEDVSTLEDEDIASGLGEVRGARETVVPATHHDDISLRGAHGAGG